MIDDFDRILDECLNRINRGESLEACLTSYPEYAERLEPLLQTVLKAREAYSFAPSVSAKQAAREHFNQALREINERQQAKEPLFAKLIARPLTWAAVAAVLLIAIFSYLGLRTTIQPVAAMPDPEGNFVFLISDEVNAIGDFDRLSVSVSRVVLLLSGGSEKQVEFEPEIKEVDLTLLKGDETQQIWRGNIPEGDYTEVVIHISDVKGLLKATQQPVDIKLPSQKLKMSNPFKVNTETVTSFTYDLTVVAAGSPKSGFKYLLKPQADQSGVEHKPSEKGKGNKK